jgi:hypothetical protein
MQKLLMVVNSCFKSVNIDQDCGISNIEWIWGSARTDQSNYYWNAPASMTDHTTVSYSATYVNNDFVNLFSTTDVRASYIRKVQV